MNCPNCGNEIKDERAVYCPYCSKPLRVISPKKTRFPIAGGILTMLASCVSVLFAVMGTVEAYLMSLPSVYAPVGAFYAALFAGIFGFVAFALGLAGGIMAIRRKNFALSIVGTCFTVIEGFIIMLGIVYLSGVLIGFPIVILSTLGLIFVAISKAEFA